MNWQNGSAEKEHLYESVSHKDLRLILKFHVHGMMGILKECDSGRYQADGSHCS